MTVRQRFGGIAVVRVGRGHQLREFGPGMVRQVCGCCGRDAVMWGTFVSELGISCPNYWDRKPLCSPCRQGLTMLTLAALR